MLWLILHIYERHIAVVCVFRNDAMMLYLRTYQCHVDAVFAFV